MKIKWLGHASFLITSDTGIRIITDPFDASYVAGDGPSYGEITESADIVTISHDHSDHNNVAAVQGNPKVVKDKTTWVLPAAILETSYVRSRIPGLQEDKEEIGNIRFNATSTYHDNTEGKQRGTNTIFCFEMDGIRVCHLGDLGHQLSDKQVAELGSVDILLIPVGGYYTIDAKVATQVCDQLKPKVIIPMHFKTDKCGFPIAGVGEFLKGKDNVNSLDTSEVEFKQGELPSTTQIIVLKPAL